MMRDLSTMDVRFDQTGAGEAPARIIGSRRGCQAPLDRNDLPAGGADVRRLAREAIGEPHIAYDQVHVDQSREGLVTSSTRAM